MTGTSQAHGHFHNGGLSGGVVIPQVNQRAAKVLEQRLIHVHDVGKLGQGGCGIVGNDIRAVAQVDHGTGKLHQVRVFNAQLTSHCDNLGNIVCRRSHLGGHLLDRAGKRSKLFFRSIDCFANAGESTLIVDAGLDRCSTKRQDRRCERSSQGFAGFDQAFTDRIAFLSETRKSIAGCRPCGFSGFQFLAAFSDISLRLFYSGAGIIER